MSAKHLASPQRLNIYTAHTGQDNNCQISHLEGVYESISICSREIIIIYPSRGSFPHLCPKSIMDDPIWIHSSKHILQTSLFKSPNIYIVMQGDLTFMSKPTQSFSDKRLPRQRATQSVQKAFRLAAVMARIPLILSFHSNYAALHFLNCAIKCVSCKK